jgi:hypothetical protein
MPPITARLTVFSGIADEDIAVALGRRPFRTGGIAGRALHQGAILSEGIGDLRFCRQEGSSRTARVEFMYDAHRALEERVRARFKRRRGDDHSRVARSEDAMDFIERLFGVAPDNGDGSIELLCFASGSHRRRRLCLSQAPVTFDKGSAPIGSSSTFRRRKFVLTLPYRRDVNGCKHPSENTSVH